MRKIIIMVLLTVYAFSLSMSDIEVMRKSGVLITLPDEKKEHSIAKGMKPSELIKVNYIRLNNQALYFVPNWLPEMTNLTKLELKNTKLNLKELLKLKTLSNLKILDISDNPLFTKDDDLVEFLSTFSLTELNLSHTGGSSKNYKNITKLSSLVKLDLSSNAIVEIDSLKLEKLLKLKSLSLANNKMSGILNTQNLPKKSLRRLDLSGNKFVKIGFSGDFPLLSGLKILNNGCQMKFAKEYDNPYLFVSMERGDGAFDKNIMLPKSLLNRLKISTLLKYSGKKLFPLYGVTLGKTTLKELTQLGKRSRMLDNKGIPYRCFMVNGMDFWFFDAQVAESVYINYTDPMPTKWKKLNLTWDKSYAEWLKILKNLGFKVNAIELPKVVIYDGHNSFSAEIEAIKEGDTPLRIELDFSYSKGTTIYSKGTLYSLDVSVL